MPLESLVFPPTLARLNLTKERCLQNGHAGNSSICMNASSKQVRELLLRAQQRFKCFAVALLVPPNEVCEIHCATGQDGAHARSMIERSADSFAMLFREQREPVIRNRVRDVPGGPLICRFLAAPLYGDDGKFVGMMMLFNPANSAEFGDIDARLAVRYAKVFAKAISVPRDALTGLLARESFEHKVAVWKASQAEASAALLYGDIDQLHVINDLFGFQTGDRAIAIAGQKLNAIVTMDGAASSRLSGDRFTVFIPNCSMDRARQIANTIREAVSSARLTSSAQPIPMSMSWGVAMLRAAETTLDHGLAAAEIACKAAKDRGRNRVEVYQDTDASIIRRRDDMLIVGRLRTALDEGRFQVFGQPIASLLQAENTRRYEMLVRILDEDDKLVLPQAFMSSATRYQLLPQLDRCVIGHVLAKIADARAKPGFRPIHVSLNISGPSISEPEFVDWLLAELERSGVPGDWVSFEVTETAAIANIDRAQQLIEKLGAKGCKFALDDFGTGLSSLAYLKALNIAAIKIDGSFIRDILENKRSESLVRAIAQLANSMGIETVAEYVESSAICMRLIELGVEFGQGYALGKPVLLDKLIERMLSPMGHLALAS
jgi:diguanylate cyclase (GGDEF)-like protein